MNKIFGTILIILAFLIVHRLDADDSQLKGLKDIRFWSQKHPKNVQKKQVFFNFENLSKYSELNEWLKEKGFPINDNQKIEFLLKFVKEIISKAWNDAIWDLLHCEAFKNYQTEDGKRLIDIFQDRLNNKKYLFFFSDPSGEDLTPFDEGSVDQLERMRLKMGYLESIVKYCADKIKNNNSNLTDYKSNNDLYMMYSYMGHEMLHLFAMLDRGLEKETKEHCELFCLQKTCLKFSNNIPQYCDSLCKTKDGYCKKGEFEPCDRPSPNNRGDPPDDNFSFFNLDSFEPSIGGSFPGYFSGFSNEINLSYYPDILIYNKFNFNEMQSLLSRLSFVDFIDDYEHDEFSLNHRVLIIPSGEIMGDKNSVLIKEALKNFVMSGNTLIVLGQQYGEDFEKLIPIPEGESLKAYGWREDQSCLWGSTYFKDQHPALSSLWNEKIAVGIDGYFSNYPANSTVLLRKVQSQEPVLLYYPYGKGTVILTSMFTDYAFAHSQASQEELKLIRDLVTFARNPSLPIPMFDLNQDSTPAVSMNVLFKNTTETASAKIKIRVLSPDRSRVFLEREESIALAPGEEKPVQIDFEYPELQWYDYVSCLGIGHTDYELYDADGNLVQWSTEADTGRFAVHKITTPYTNPNTDFLKWVTVKDEEIFAFENIDFTLHFKNNTDETKTVDVKDPFLVVGHHHQEIPVPSISVTVPPHSYVKYDYSFPVSSFDDESFVIQNSGATLRFQYYDSGGELRQLGNAKYVFVKKSFPTIGFHVANAVDGKIKDRAPITYSFSIKNDVAYDLGPVEIKLTAVDREGYVQAVYEGTQNLGGSAEFKHSDTFQPVSRKNGPYAFRLELANKTFGKKTSYHTYFRWSNIISLSDPELIGAVEINGHKKCLKALGNYKIRFKVKNRGPYDIEDGAYNVAFRFLRSFDFDPVFFRTLTGIKLQVNEEKEFEEEFAFIPSNLAGSGYYPFIAFWDETQEDWMERYKYDDSHLFHYVIDTEAVFDKPYYECGDVAKLSYKITTANDLMDLDFLYHFYNFLTGRWIEIKHETRQVLFPEGVYTKVEEFQVPIVLTRNPLWIVVKMVDKAGHVGGQDIIINRIKPIVEMKSMIDRLTAHAGDPIELKVNVKGISGFSNPLHAILRADGPGLNFQQTQNVTVLPGQDNLFTFTVPVPADVNAGKYDFWIDFDVDYARLDANHIRVEIPAPGMVLSEPPSLINAGESISLDFTNPGGKNGNYEISIKLKDNFRILLSEHAETREIGAGEKINLAVPVGADLKSGDYGLYQSVRETLSGRVFERFSPIKVTGLALALDAHMLKNPYFDNEVVSGRADVSGGGLTNGKLQAAIYQSVVLKGIEEIRCDETLKRFRNIGCSQQYGDKLFTLSWLDDPFSSVLFSYDVKTRIVTDIEIGLDADILSGFRVGRAGGLWMMYEKCDGLWYRDASGNKMHYTTAEGLLSDEVWDVVEKEDGSVWVATSAGVSVLRDGQWQAYSTLDGSPIGQVYKLVVDGSGGVWAMSENGFARFYGGEFTRSGVPAGNDVFDMAVTMDGTLWAVSADKVFRKKADGWDEWSIKDIYPGLESNWIAASGNEIWVDGYVPASNIYVLLKYDGSFTVYSGDAIPIINKIWGYVLDSGPGSYFLTFDDFFGMAVFANNELKSLEVPFHGLVSSPKNLAAGVDGKLWIGTDKGISQYDGQSWHSFIYKPSGDCLNVVSAVAVDSQGRAYAAADDGIYPIGTEVLPRIEYPQGMSDTEDVRMAAGSSGKLWLFYRGKLYFYDGSWHLIMQFDSYPGSDITELEMIPDQSDGLFAWKRKSTYAGKLLHFKGDGTIENITLPALSLPSDYHLDKVRLFLDKTGKLWAAIEAEWEAPAIPLAFNRNGTGQVEASGMRGGPFAVPQDDEHPPFYFLYTCDGTNWVDLSTMEGFPSGIAAMAENTDGEMTFLVSPNNLDTTFFVLRNDRFVNTEVKFYPDADSSSQRRLVYAGDSFYTIGNLTDTWMNNLLRVRDQEILGEKEIWAQEFPVSTSSGSINIDLKPGKALTEGNYVLKGEVLNSLGQRMAESGYPFVVRGSAVSVSLNRDNAQTPYVRPDAEISFTNTVFNNTGQGRSGLQLLIKKVSPAGEENVITQKSVDLAAGQSLTDSFTFRESGQGTWKIFASISDGGTILSQVETVLEVTAPQLGYEVTAPEYAGDDPFALKVRLTNSGKIEGGLHVTVGAQHVVPLIDEDIFLQPGEERIVSGTTTISADHVYDIVFTGDLEKSEQRIVLYGFKENLVFNVLPVYREGDVSIGCTIANSGGLPFQETFHAEVFPLGSAVPAYTVNRIYNLYPRTDAITDQLSFMLAPGSYELRYRTGRNPGVQTLQVNVLPAGIGQLAFTPMGKYPLGRSEFAYTLTNSDTVPGTISLTFDILDAANAPVFNETRSVFLNPGESSADAFAYEFMQTGSYTLRVSGAKLAGGASAFPVRILKTVDVTASAAIQTASGGMIPVQVNIANSGFSEFKGTLTIESGGIIHQEVLQVASENASNQTYGLDTNALTTGNHEVKATIQDSTGNTLFQATQTVMVKNADIRVSETPQGLEIPAGGFIQTSIKVKNGGNRRGEARIRLTSFDNHNEQRDIYLEPGQEISIDDIYIDADSDIPTGNYPCTYTLTGTGVASGLHKGNFTFKVNGISLDVNARLDKSLYQEGDTAQLTLDISSAIPVTSILEAVVNWGDFSEKREFSLDSGSTSQTFNIPLATMSQGKVFYGIYHKEGRGIYLNDIYLNFAGAVSVILDKQVYAPGDTVNAAFLTLEPGVLTAEAFGDTKTVNINSQATMQFAVPADTIGGTYGVSWSFTPADAAHQAGSGSKQFDVSGLVVKVAKAETDRGKYASGDTIKSSIIFESNRDISLTLQTWTSSPAGNWNIVGQQPVALSKDHQIPVVYDSTFQTTEAGTHYLVYGLYAGDRLVVSGSIAFDCGDAVLLGVSTDRAEYMNGNENVKVALDHFGQGTATLQLFLDEVKFDERSITLSGLGRTEVVLDAATIGGGAHRLRAVISKDNLTSTRSASFTYGSNLPDLTVDLLDRVVDGLNYTYQVRVSNMGKTAAPASLLVFLDNDAEVNGETVGSLPAGQSQEKTFNWSGSGKAGVHRLVFEADNADAIKEFNEGNNRLELSEDVPALFYKLEVQPQIWSANMTATIYSRMINNQDTAAVCQLHMALTRNADDEKVLDRFRTVSIGAFSGAVETDLFETGIHPAGDYTLSQTLMSGSVSLSQELVVPIEATRALTGTVTPEPATVRAGVDSFINLKMNLKNAGNVVLEDEPLIISVINKESQQEVRSDTLAVTLNLAEQKLFEKAMTLNLAAGVYTMRLKMLSSVVAESEVTAIEGLEKQKAISGRPRVLLMNALGFPFAGQKNFIKAVLQAGYIPYTDTDNLVGSYVSYQKVENNINMVFGNLLAPGLKEEIKERVWRGEGLIMFCATVLSENGFEDMLGVRVKAVPILKQEKDFTVIPGVLGNGGAFSLSSKGKVCLEKVAPDAVAAAESKIGKLPVIVYRPYGAGKVVTIAIPVDTTNNPQLMGQLLTSATLLLNSSSVFAASDLSRVVPLELRIRNTLNSDKTYLIKETIPVGVESWGYDPNPEQGEELKWRVTIPAGNEKGIFYWVKLPDRIGTFELKSEICEGDRKLDEALLTLEVLQAVRSRLDEIVAEIGLVEASGGDEDKLILAARLLENARNRSGEDIISLWLDVTDCVLAAKALREVVNADVSALRLKVQNVMLAYARKFYEKAKTLTPLEIGAFGTRLNQ